MPRLLIALAARFERNFALIFWALLASLLIVTGGVHLARQSAEVLTQHPPAQGHVFYERLQEAAHLFAYAASALVSYFAAQWWLFLLDALLAALWLLPRPGASHPVLAGGAWAVDFLNRQLGHVGVAFLAVIAVANWLQPWPVLMLVASTGAVLAAPRAVDQGVTRFLLWRRRSDERRARVEADLFWARRIVFHALNALGVLLLFVAAPVLWRELVRTATLALLAIALRSYRWVRNYRRARHGAEHEETRSMEAPEARELRRRWDRRIVVVAVLVGLLPATSIIGSADAADKRLRDQHWTRCASDLVNGAPPRSEADASLFIVSDSQFHELRGRRAGSHLDIIDALVPVAVRPVELDLLSGATLAHFGAALKAMPGGQPWAHLGDAADLACSAELDRFGEVLDAHYPKRGLAFLLPGNHDSTFVGNFHWHPDWDRACRPRYGAQPGEYLRKDRSDAKLAAIARQMGLRGELIGVHQHPVMKHTGPTRTALYGAVELGRIGPGKTRQLVGAFVDTSDFTLFDPGIAGASGSISRGQLGDLKAALAKMEPDAAVVLFVHHPLGEMSSCARKLLKGLHDQVLHERLLAVVSAHTHLAGLRDHRCAEKGWDGPRVPELVVGSVIDPPQEASLLEVWGDGGGSASLRLRAMPAVAREGASCSLLPPAHGAAGALTGARCSALLTGLAQVDDCKPLFLEAPPVELDDRQPAPSTRPDAVFASSGAKAATPVAARDDYTDADARSDASLCGNFRRHRQAGLLFTAEPEDVYCDQRERAVRLRHCVCRGATCSKAGNPLDPRLYDAVFNERPERRDELVCLSWAASILQDKKARGWPLARALAFANDRSAVYGALEMFVDLRKTACHTDQSPQLTSIPPP